MAKLKTLSHKAKLEGKRVLMRLDLNVPLKTVDGEIKVADASRIKEAVPSILRLHRANTRLIIISHLGRPEGKPEKKLRLQPVVEELRRHLPPSITLIEHTSWQWDKITKAVEALRPGQVLILENLRFCREEDANDKSFAKRLANLADIYINEAFSVSHRAAASLVAITKFLPSYAGWRLAKEVEIVTRVRDKARQPLVVVLGGAKVHEKTDLMISLAPKASAILVGGVIANTIWQLQKMSIGKSRADKKPDKKALQKILRQTRIFNRQKSPLLNLPIDVVVARSLKSKPRVVNLLAGGKVLSGETIFDIGPATIGLYAEKLRRAKTIIWNGPLGLIEEPKFRHGSLAVARVIGSLSRGRAFSVAGGGESLDVLESAKVSTEIDWVSTGGGAMLTLLAKRKLPGLEALGKS